MSPSLTTELLIFLNSSYNASTSLTLTVHTDNTSFQRSCTSDTPYFHEYTSKRWLILYTETIPFPLLMANLNARFSCWSPHNQTSLQSIRLSMPEMSSENTSEVEIPLTSCLACKNTRILITRRHFILLGVETAHGAIKCRSNLSEGMPSTTTNANNPRLSAKSLNPSWLPPAWNTPFSSVQTSPHNPLLPSHANFQSHFQNPKRFHPLSATADHTRPSHNASHKKGKTQVTAQLPWNKKSIKVPKRHRMLQPWNSTRNSATTNRLQFKEPRNDPSLPPSLLMLLSATENTWNFFAEFYTLLRFTSHRPHWILSVLVRSSTLPFPPAFQGPTYEMRERIRKTD